MTPAVTVSSAPISTDYMSLSGLAQRLQVSERTLKDLAKREGLPLRRLTAQGPIYCFWSEVESWLRKRKT